MNIANLVQKAEEIKAVMERVGKNIAYLVAVQENGTLDGYDSRGITGPFMFEALSPRFEDLQSLVDQVPDTLHAMIFPACGLDVAVLSRDAIAVLSDRGLEIKLDFDDLLAEDRVAYITAIFEVEVPALPVPRSKPKKLKLSF